MMGRDLDYRTDAILHGPQEGDVIAGLLATREYDILASQIYQKLEENNWTTFGVSSPRVGDGKSTVVYNLAKSMARERKHTVMVVDVNVYNPSVHTLFGVSGVKNIRHALEHEVDLAEVIVSPGVERLRIIPGAHLGQAGADLMSSHRFSELVTEIKDRYADRICIFDMPSFLDSNAALTILPYLDTLLLAVRDCKTHRKDVELVARLLGDKKILGVVLNDVAK